MTWLILIRAFRRLSRLPLVSKIPAIPHIQFSPQSFPIQLKRVCKYSPPRRGPHCTFELHLFQNLRTLTFRNPRTFPLKISNDLLKNLFETTDTPFPITIAFRRLKTTFNEL